MDVYSFQYPPRPSPCDVRPKRYYFHSIEQDKTIARSQCIFQKEGSAPGVRSASPIFTGTISHLEVLDRSKYLAQ